MAFPKIIIYRDVKPNHIFLDKNLTAKLSDMSFSISLEEGTSQIEAEDVLGTYGYLLVHYTLKHWLCQSILMSTALESYLWFFSLVDRFTFSVSGGYPVGILEYVKGLYEVGKLSEVTDPMMMKDISSAQRSEVEASVFTCTEMLRGEG